MYFKCLCINKLVIIYIIDTKSNSVLLNVFLKGFNINLCFYFIRLFLFQVDEYYFQCMFPNNKSMKVMYFNVGRYE